MFKTIVGKIERAATGFNLALGQMVDTRQSGASSMGETIEKRRRQMQERRAEKERAAAITATQPCTVKGDPRQK